MTDLPGAALRRPSHSYEQSPANQPIATNRSAPSSGAECFRTTLSASIDSALRNAISPAGALGRLVTTPDDRPIRTIITGRRRIVTGSYASRKAGRALPFESMNERAFFMHSEVDTGVVDYRAQPFRFEFALNGKHRIYIADCARLLASGRIEVVEVKNDPRALRDQDYLLKLERAAALCALLGWDFRVVLANELVEDRIVHANVLEVQMRRHVRLDASHIHAAAHAIQSAGGAVMLGALADILGGRRSGTAIAQAMMVQRLVEIDLTHPIGADSIVKLVDRTARGEVR